MKIKPWIVDVLAVAAIFTMIGVIASCGQAQEQKRNAIEVPPQPRNETHALGHVDWRQLEVVRLKDGTRCAVAYHTTDTRSGVGLSCDWSRNDLGLEEP